jgi:hypothetical protein
MSAEDIAARLEYLRGEIDAERISMSELIELQNLTEHIDPGDVHLLEWAGVPEHPEASEDALTIRDLIRALETIAEQSSSSGYDTPVYVDPDGSNAFHLELSIRTDSIGSWLAITPGEIAP